MCIFLNVKCYLVSVVFFFFPKHEQIFEFFIYLFSSFQAVDYGVHRLWEYNNVGVCHLLNVCPLYFFFGALHALIPCI